VSELDSGCVACSSGISALRRRRTENEKMSQTSGLTQKRRLLKKKDDARSGHLFL
jgi:hypothetical protein